MRDVSGAKFLGVEISVGRNQFQLVEWPRPQLAFHTLCSRFPQIQRFEETVKSNEVRQIIVEISRAENDPFVPEPLLNSRVPS